MIKPRVRDFWYLYNSRIDFVDFYLCVIILLTGLICLISQPLEHMGDSYKYLVSHGVSSFQLGIYCLAVSGMNLTRLFLHFKLNVCFISILKCSMLSVFLLIFFGVLGNKVLPLTIGYLLVAILLSLDNIKRT